MYVFGFLAAWGLATFRASRPNSGWTSEEVGDLIFYGALGVVLGGRIGYMVFYDFPSLVANPLNLFKVWQGGMSFHGGVLGVVVAIWLFARRFNKTFWTVGDFVVPLLPLGLAAGRIGNFINGELWGKPTTVAWGMVFPHVDQLPRHPSQLYEFLLEGVLLFIILWTYSAKPKPPGRVGGLFLICYGVFRVFVEFFRQPDPQFGYLAFGWLTMGQLLSVPMVLVGLWFMKRKGIVTTM